MSADGSANPSNESPASSVSNLVDDKPPLRFISMELPTFAPFTVTHEPPSFVLSAALEEATQQHPPVSPGMATRIFNCAWCDYIPRNEPLSAEEAEDFLLENDNLSATVHATTYRLVSTIHRRAAQHSHYMQQSEQCITKQHNLVAQREEEIAHLRARPGATEAPWGFLPNEGRVSCVIPAAGGGLVVPHFI